MRLGDEALEVGERAVARMDVLVIRDVVAVVAQRRRIERQQPDRVHAKALEVIELLGEAGEVADAIVGAVEEGANVRLIDDGVLEPERIVNHGGVAICEDMRHAARRIEADVVLFAAPEVALVRQQIDDLECRIQRQAPVRQRQPHEAMLHVERVEVHDHQQEVAAVDRALAVAQQLGIVGVVELQTPVVLQCRVLAANRVDARDHFGKAPGLIEAADANLVFLGIQVLLAAFTHRHVLAQLEAAVDAVAGAQRRRQHEARLERRRSASLQVLVQDVGGVREEVRPHVLADLGLRQLGEVVHQSPLSCCAR